MNESPTRGHPLPTLLTAALAALTTAASGQCPIVGSGIGIRSDRVQVSAVTAWDPDGSGPLPATAVIAGAPVLAPGLAIGLLNGKIATFDFGSGAAVPIGSVNALVSDLDVLNSGLLNGQLLAAGEFTTVNGAPLGNLARYDGTNWSVLGASPDGPVDRVLVLGNGDVIAGGRFTAIGGQPIARLARFDGTSWSAVGGGVNGRVRTLALDQSGNLVVGGDFTLAGTTAANHIASWNGSTWSPFGAGTDAPVSTVTLLQNGRLAVGGYFLNAGGASAQFIAQWDGASWSQLGGNANHFVHASVLLQNGDLLISGQFYQIGSQPLNAAAVWNGSSWSAPSEPITARYPATMPGGQQVLWPYVQSGTGFVTVGRGFNDALYKAEVDSVGNLYVTGRFTNVLGVPAVSVARYDGVSWSALGTGIPTPIGGVYELCIAENDQVFCSGAFYASNGAAADYLVRWDGSTWTGVGTGTDARVDALVARTGGGIIAGGAFTTAGGIAAGGIAEWDGTAWSALGNVAGGCQDLALLENGDLLAVGFFTSPAGRVIRWDGSAWTAIPGSIDGAVYCVEQLPDRSIVIGGLFNSAGGVPGTGRIARWDGTAWSALGSGLPSAVTSMFVLPDGDIVTNNTLGGAFSGAAVRFDGTAWLPFAGIKGPVLDFALLPDGSLAAVGRMTEVAGVFVDGFAILNSTCPPAIASVPSGCAAPSLAAIPDGLPWIGGAHHVNTSGFLAGSLGAVLIGLSSPGTLLSTLHPNALLGCRQLASSEAVALTIPTNGIASFDLRIPDNAAFVGVQLFEQFAELRFSGMQLVSIVSSNGLRLTVGGL